eukprot:GILI01012143.1.p1 GENE.GILI01012143.1~~GILI01012143.1.p1  ORF type:complete len:1008 (+),score=304.22 GILI01012143.1:274-3024(+)
MFLLAAAAKDCSLMISLQLLPQGFPVPDSSPLPVLTDPDTGARYRFRLAVIDFDVKGPVKLNHYLQQDRQIMQAVLEYLANGYGNGYGNGSNGYSPLLQTPIFGPAVSACSSIFSSSSSLTSPSFASSSCCFSSSSSSSSPAMNPATLQSDALRKKNAAQAPKKMVIKPFKVKPQLPENFEEETWNRLRSAVVAIFQRQPVTASLEELYRAVEDMCLHKMAPSLYSKLQEESQVHIKGKVEALLGAGDDLELFLQVVDRTWNDLCAQLITVRSVFLYLDRTYVLQTASLKSLWDAGLAQFKEHLSVYPELQRKTVEGLLVLIEKERMGEAVDRTLIKSLVRMLTSLALYSAGFEPPFLEATDKFYAAEGARLMQEIEVSEYLKHVENRLQQEQDRVNNYLDRNTRRPLLLALERQLLAVHVSAILEKSGPLFDQCRLPDLSRLFSLLSRVSALDQLKASWAAYLKRTGLSLVQDEERDKSLVEDLLALKARADSILEQAFQKNENFTFALKDAFESFVNSRQNKPAELIAKFIDEKLKTGFKGSSEEELEQLLDKVLVIFRYITEKDVFEAFYKKDLAKRLLLAKSASFDTEKSMIAKLKAECGSGFTSKLEGMFKDIDLSKDIMAAFEQRLKEPTDSTSPSSSSTPSTTPSSSSPSSSSSSSSSSPAPALAPVPSALVAQVKSVLSDLGDGFIEACLRAMQMNPERVISAIFDNALPAEVAKLDRAMPSARSRASSSSSASAPSAASSSSFSSSSSSSSAASSTSDSSASALFSVTLPSSPKSIRRKVGAATSQSFLPGLSAAAAEASANPSPPVPLVSSISGSSLPPTPSAISAASNSQLISSISSANSAYDKPMLVRLPSTDNIHDLSKLASQPRLQLLQEMLPYVNQSDLLWLQNALSDEASKRLARGALHR